MYEICSDIFYNDFLYIHTHLNVFNNKSLLYLFVQNGCTRFAVQIQCVSKFNASMPYDVIF